jgi:hypothetical protein
LDEVYKLEELIAPMNKKVTIYRALPRIRISTIKYLFRSLANIDDCWEDDVAGETALGEDLEGIGLIEPTRFKRQGSLVPMPWPLKGVALSLQRREEYYSAVVCVVPRERVQFRGLSRKIGQVSILGTKWKSVEPNGIGYVTLFENKQEPDLCVSRPDLEGDFEIHLGDAGCVKRKYDSEQSFKKEVGWLETMTNAFVYSCYALYGKPMKGLPPILNLSI